MTRPENEAFNEGVSAVIGLAALTASNIRARENDRPLPYAAKALEALANEAAVFLLPDTTEGAAKCR